MTIHDFFEAEYSDSANQRNIWSVLNAITKAAVSVSDDLKKAALLENVLGAQGGQNIQGEDQQKLDVIADLAFIEAFKSCGAVTGIGSEENEAFVSFDTEISKKADYVVLFDPLDGSSNIDVNVSLGTIFSIYKRVSPTAGPATLSDFLQKGTEQVAAGYILYGTSTLFVYTTGNGVNGFTLNPAIGTFYLSHPNIQLPHQGHIYSINEANYATFPETIKAYLKDRKSKDALYTTRYIGSMVSDIHRNMFKGGIYLYPPNQKSPEGKLRLLYECNPMAFIIEQAGGTAISMKKRILEIDPTSLHQRVPFFCGNREMISALKAFL